MKEFRLALGESTFRLELTDECAALLGAFYPCAQPEGPTDDHRPTHTMRVRRLEGGLEASWPDSEANDAADAAEAGGGGPVFKTRFAAPGAAMFALEEAIERLVIADATANLALHGGAVTTSSGGAACLILGDSDSGKSTTTFQLVELGAGFLCEEIALCDTRDWRAVPYPQTLALTDSLLDEFANQFEITGRRYPLVPPIVRYEPRRLPDPDAPAPPVERILLPRFRFGAATSVEQISPEDALPEVLGYSFPPNVDEETQFDRVIALLERVETVRLVYPDAASARAALSELFEL